MPRNEPTDGAGNPLRQPAAEQKWGAGIEAKLRAHDARISQLVSHIGRVLETVEHLAIALLDEQDARGKVARLAVDEFRHIDARLAKLEGAPELDASPMGKLARLAGNASANGAAAGAESAVADGKANGSASHEQ